MPPKKKGNAAASPATKRRLTASAKRAPAKKRQDAEEASAPARDDAGDPYVEPEDMEGATAAADDVDVLEGPSTETEEVITTVKPGGEDATATKGEEAEGLEGSEEEEMDAAAAVTGEGQDSHLAEDEMEPEGTDVDMVPVTDDAAAKGVEGTASLEEELIGEMPVDGVAGTGQEELVSGDGSNIPSSSVDVPASLPLQQTISVVHSVDELRRISTVLSAFTRCWDRLSEHLSFIQTSMDAFSKVPGTSPCLPSSAAHQTYFGETAADNKLTPDMGQKEEAKEAEQTPKAPPMDLESICEKMLGRNLRRYVVAHMSDIDSLREEVPKALRLAPDPAKLVLSCIGRFYLQGSKAYIDPNSPMVSIRRACILVLEFFLLSSCLPGGVDKSPSAAIASDATEGGEASGGKEEISASILEEAKVAALAWKNRLVAEGGIASASAVDARGLALFVASFGILPEFDSEMMYHVFRLSNLKKTANVLRQSPIIAEKLPDIIGDLVQKEKYMEAADLVCGFGLQEKYSPLDLIASFLSKVTVADEEKIEGQSSVRLMKEAAANQLAAYKSVLRCVEEYKLDPSSLASFKIKENIARLEKDVPDHEKVLKDANLKRKADHAQLPNKAKGWFKRPASATAKAGKFASRAKATRGRGRALSNVYRGASNRFPGMLEGSGVGNLQADMLAPTGAGGGYSVYGWHQEGASGDSSVGQTYAGAYYAQNNVMGPPTAENLSQLQGSSVGVGSMAGGSNLYQFADSVTENELYHGHSVRSNGPPAAGYR